MPQGKHAFTLPGRIVEIATRIPNASHHHWSHIRNHVILVKVSKSDVFSDFNLIKTLGNVEPFGTDKPNSILDQPCSDAEAQRHPVVPGGNPETG